MQVIRCPNQMQQLSLQAKREGRRTVLVPTMGYLHEGHLSLVRIGRKLGDVLVVSVFVNPTQFGPGEDLEAYPRDFEGDCRACREEGTDIVFCPEPDAMYPPGATVHVAEDRLSRVLCGVHRPRHFGGVLTVVAKLFNLALPDVAVFGSKDAQQVVLIRRMTRDLDFPVEIVAGPTVREPDGLAMSSRNAYLTPAERRDARCLSRALARAETLFAGGARDASALKGAMEDTIAAAPSAEIDYAEVVDADTLEPVETIGAPVLAAVAARFGRARLIDNTLLTETRGVADR